MRLTNYLLFIWQGICLGIVITVLLCADWTLSCKLYLYCLFFIMPVFACMFLTCMCIPPSCCPACAKPSAIVLPFLHMLFTCLGAALFNMFLTFCKCSAFSAFSSLVFAFRLFLHVLNCLRLFCLVCLQMFFSPRTNCASPHLQDRRYLTFLVCSTLICLSMKQRATAPSDASATRGLISWQGSSTSSVSQEARPYRQVIMWLG